MAKSIIPIALGIALYLIIVNHRNWETKYKDQPKDSILTEQIDLITPYLEDCHKYGGTWTWWVGDIHIQGKCIPPIYIEGKPKGEEELNDDTQKEDNRSRQGAEI